MVTVSDFKKSTSIVAKTIMLGVKMSLKIGRLKTARLANTLFANQAKVDGFAW